MMFLRKGQTVVQNTITFLFIIVGIIILSVIASVTTPFLYLQVNVHNITGGMGLLVRYWNVVLIIMLMMIGLFIAFGGGRR